MTGAEIAMVAVMAVGTVSSMASAQSQAKFAAAAAEREKVAAEEAKIQAQLAASQKEVLRLEELRRTKATQRAQAAALGFDPTQSRSFLAIVDDTERHAQRDIDNIRLEALFVGRKYDLLASAADVEMSGARAAGRFSTAGAFLSGGARITKFGMDTGFLKTSKG